MKAREVAGLKPGRTLAESSARTARVRLEELLDLAFDALEPRASRPQHDMRIAAKRLRYVLEVTGFCLGEEVAAEALDAARALQQVLGDLHDSDEFDARVKAHLRHLREADAAVVRGAAGEESDLRPELAAYAPSRNAYRGLELLRVYAQARRTLLFERFAERFAQQQRDGVWERLAEAAERTLERTKSARKSKFG